MAIGLVLVGIPRQSGSIVRSYVVDPLSVRVQADVAGLDILNPLTQLLLCHFVISIFVNFIVDYPEQIIM